MGAYLLWLTDAVQSFNLEFGWGLSAGLLCNSNGDTKSGKLEEEK